MIVIDRESECYLGLRSIFSSLVSITTFMPLVEPELNDIMAYHMAIAQPASVIDGLMSGGAIPTPLGQLSPCYCHGIDSCLRKLSHWYLQDCFSSMQCKEFVKNVIYKPLHLRQTTQLKRPDGYGGYANFHNCAFTGFSWRGIVNSDTTHNDCHYWTFPASCLRTAIVLEIPLSVEDLASLTHCSSYCNCNPTEAYHRHCSFPIGMQGMQGVPPLSLLTDDGAETPLHDERNIASQQRLSKNEKDILIAAATEIAKKRKDFSE